MMPLQHPIGTMGTGEQPQPLPGPPPVAHRKGLPVIHAGCTGGGEALLRVLIVRNERAMEKSPEGAPLPRAETGRSLDVI